MKLAVKYSEIYFKNSKKIYVSFFSMTISILAFILRSYILKCILKFLQKKLGFNLYIILTHL